MNNQDIRQAAILACEVASEKKGEEVVLVDLREQSALADYLVIVTSRSQPHSRGIAQAIQRALDDFPLTRRGMEGYPDGPWILLDYYHIIVHIFGEEERDYYNIQRLWSSAKVTRFSEELANSA